MFKLGITGGIGAGKSTACNFFKKKGASIFNADNEAKKYLNSNLQLQKKIINAYDNIYFNNKFNFTKLSEVAFSSKTNQIQIAPNCVLEKIQQLGTVSGGCVTFWAPRRGAPPAPADGPRPHQARGGTRPPDW